MKLVRIAGNGLHGHTDFRHRIGPVTLFVGPNESGKSTRLGAFQIALMGPKAGRWPILGPSPAYEWVTRLRFEDSDGDEVNIARGMDDRHRQYITFDGRTGTLRALQGEIKRRLGAPSVWRLSDFLDLSPTRRLAFLERGILRGAGWTADQLVERVGAVVDDLPALLQLASCSDWPGEDAQVSLVELLSALDTVQRSANQRALQLAAVVRELSAAEGEADLPPGSVSGWTEERSKIDIKIAACREQHGFIRGQEAVRATLETQIAQDTAELVAMRERDLPAELHAASLAVARCEEIVADAHAEHEAREKDSATYAARCDTLRQEGDTLRTRADKIRGMIDAEDLVRDALQFVNQHVQVILDWSEDFDLRPPHVVQAIDALRKVATDPRSELDRRLEEADAPWRAQKVRIDAAARVSERERERAATALRHHRDALQEAEAARTVRDRLQRLLDARSDNERKVSERLSAAREQLAEIGTGDISAVEAELSALRQRRREISTTLVRLNDFVDLRARLGLARVESSEVTAKRTKARAAVNALRGVLAAMLTEVISPFSADVSRITQAALGARFVPQLEGGFSYTLSRGDLSLGTGSQSVHVVTMMALRAAIVRRMSGWRALACDDMENLEPARRSAFLSAMVAETAAGRLDNFLGACVLPVDSDWEPPPGVTLIKLEF